MVSSVTWTSSMSSYFRMFILFLCLLLMISQERWGVHLQYAWKWRCMWTEASTRHCCSCFKINVLKDRIQTTEESSLKRSSALTLDCGGALMVQIQSKASPGFTRSSSSTWLERIIPSHPLISNWQSVERQRKCGGEVRIKKKAERKKSWVNGERWQGGHGGRNNKEGKNEAEKRNRTDRETDERFGLKSKGFKMDLKGAQWIRGEDKEEQR